MDLARAVAVAGMVMVHFGPKPVPETVAGKLYGISDGRASVLFVVLAGLGVAFLSGRSSVSHVEPLSKATRGGQRVATSARLQLILRGTLLLPLGLWLQGLEQVVLVVILKYYAVYFLIAALVLGLSDRWLVVFGLAVLAGGPLIYLWGATAFPEWYFTAPVTLMDTPAKIVRELLFSGFYPVVTRTVPLLAGLWLGSMDLRSPVVRRRLIYVGTTVAVAAALASSAETIGARLESSDLRTAEPHTQMPLWMLGAIGSACVVLGVALVVADRLPRASWPLAATGQLALSVYVGHVLLLNYIPQALTWAEVPAAALSPGTFIVVVACLCMLWRLVFSRGPLEAALTMPWWLLNRSFARTSR